MTGAHTSRSAQSQSRWKVKVKFAQSCLTLCDPVDYTVHGILQARRAEWVPFPSPGHLPNPGTEARSPTLQAESLPAEARGKLKNTRVGNLRLRQGIFPTQELNQGLLSCRFFISWATREALVSPGSTRKGHIPQYDSWAEALMKSRCKVCSYLRKSIISGGGNKCKGSMTGHVWLLAAHTRQGD